MQRSHGFTLIEVLVALAIVATALVAGLQATGALTRDAQRQSTMVLAQLCAENALVAVRITPRMPDVGDSTSTCKQAGRDWTVRVVVRPTPNLNMRRVEAQVIADDQPLLQISTVVGRF